MCSNVADWEILKLNAGFNWWENHLSMGVCFTTLANILQEETSYNKTIFIHPSIHLSYPSIDRSTMITYIHTQNIPILSNYFLVINRGWLANPLGAEISVWENHKWRMFDCYVWITGRPPCPTCSPTRATAAAVSISNSQVFAGPMAWKLWESISRWTYCTLFVRLYLYNDNI